MKRLAALLGCALLLALPTAALADADDVANSVSRQVMSPFCDGLTLHDCPSDAAADLRAEIATWANAGMSEEEIIDRLVDEFGEARILATPPRSGSGLFAWLLPIAGLIAAATLGVILARRWSKASAPAPAAPVDPVAKARLDTELAELRERA